MFRAFKFILCYVIGRITTAEEKESGAVSYRTYLNFLKFAGGQIIHFKDVLYTVANV